MFEPIRRGHLQPPSGQFHGISSRAFPVALHDGSGRCAPVRPSALPAALALGRTPGPDTDADAAGSAFVVTALGFT